MNDKPTKCSFCSQLAVSIYYLSQGCAAYNNMTVQCLCVHCERKKQPLGTMELIKDLRITAILE